MFTERELEASRPKLTAFALRLTRGREEESADLVQDVMLRAWRDRHAFERGSILSIWLYRIAVDRMRVLRRREERVVLFSELGL